MKADAEDLGYMLPVIETEDDLVEAWDRYSADPDARWYLYERIDALTGASEVLSEEVYESEVILIRTAEDVPMAITRAEQDPEARWYVERRIRALGLEADYPLPWSHDA